MDIRSRDAFDTALVVVGLVLVYSHAVTTGNPLSVVGRVLDAVVSLNPIVYLVVLGLAGVLFLAYGLLYIPTRASER